MTKKIIRKVLVALLVAALVLGNNVSVFAQEIDLLIDSYEEPAVDEILEEEDILEELPDDELITDTEIEGSYPGVDIMEFCSDPEIIEEKETLSENLDDIEKCVPGEDYIEGEIIVAAKDEETAEIYAEGFGGSLGAYLDGYCLIRLDTEDVDGDGYCLTVDDAVTISANPQVPLPAAYPNYIGETLSENLSYDEYTDEVSSYIGGEVLPMYSDPYLKGTSERFQYQHELMQSEAAWRMGYTGEGVKVAVLDTGAKEGHEDLILAGKGIYSSSSAMFVIGDATMTDSNGHGTHCCGTVAATADNGFGGCGIAPKASLYAGKVEDEEGILSDWGLYSAIIASVDNWDVDIISISLRYSFPTPDLDYAVTKAYNNGTVVFVASGNQGANIMDYPANCKNAVPVGAVDEGNTKVFFSNQNSRVRYSGPGWAVWSTYKDGGYTLMDGTSMACPAVAGAAAVLLSSGKVTGTGPQRVNNLLALMDKGATKSGIGKGTPNIAKSLGISNYSVAVNSPTVFPASGNIYDQPCTITLHSAIGTHIYYNIDGGNITFKNGVVSSNTGVTFNNELTFPLDGGSNGKRVIKAVAVDPSTGLCSKVATYTYTFKTVNKVSITSKTLDFIALKGSSLQLAANIEPSTAANKTVTWSLTSSVPGVSIDGKKGLLKIDKNATVSEVEVKAIANDGSGKYDIKKISIAGGNQIKSVSPSLKSVSVYTGKKVSVNTTAVSTSGSAVSAGEFCSTSSANSAVATSKFNGDTLEITGGSTPGKTTITVYSKDGSYKKATVSVTVLQAVTRVEGIYVPTSIVQGGSVSQKVSVAPSNASNKKLIWSLTGWPSPLSQKACGVSVNAGNGQIKASASAAIGKYTVKYVAADNQGFSGTFSFDVVSAADKIKKLSVSSNNCTIFRVSNGKCANTQVVLSAQVLGGSKDNLRISENSAPGLATASVANGVITIDATGYGVGNANITVSTTDGTNLKQVIKVKVVNPPSNLLLSLPADGSMYLAYGKTLKLVPTFYTDCGPIDASSKKLVWSSSNPSVMSVSSNGTVKTIKRIVSPDDQVVVTACTTDGSGLIASIALYPNQQIAKLDSFTWLFDDQRNYAEYETVLSYYYYSRDGDNKIGWVVNYTVSGPAGGCVVIPDTEYANVFHVILRKKGNYSVIYRLNDGSNKKITCKYRCK